MDDKQTLQKLMEKQNQYAKWQCILTAAAAACCLGFFVLVLTVLPQIREVAGQMEAVLTDLEAVTEELAQADLKGMVEDVDAFVTTGQSAVEQATEKLNIIDFETLNRAIEDLADVVEPLAKFFNVFH